ncbi:uncharacterized protein SAPINGB_P005187 [Magnusiomyces paraingens]|uniref:Protein BCP1 n=1 Tax=Magnusiomyces paraingens TaxID=2606893 RepID=A0A5E8BZU2_9ASCO|nr:uncharacterized protein SAPINGB_P005187 [Saprochaete ingens]VVT56632.1 unnamed protein product [Saprochaete ingens]
MVVTIKNDKKRKLDSEQPADSIENNTKPENVSENENEEDEDDDDDEIVNVDFDYFNFKEIDFHSTKNLLRQLLGPDSIQFDLSSLSDLIISQTSLGSTIKTDGEDSDPLAILTAIDLKGEPTKCATAKHALIDYFIAKTQDYPKFNRKIRQIVSQASQDKVGLVFSERLINMPTEVVPPMYKMLQQELEADSEKTFDYLLILSKTFQEEESQLDKEERISTKKSKRSPDTKKESYFFHPEDEVTQDHALYFHSFKYSKEPQASDSKRAFYDYGIFPQGHLILVKTDKLSELVQDLETRIPPF